MSQRTTLNTVAAIVIAALAATLTLAYIAGTRVIRANQLLLAAHQRVDALQQVLSDVRDAETGQRGYLLTGNAKYLEPFSSGVTNVRRDLDVIARGSFTPRDAATLKLLVINKLTELAAIIDVRRAQGLPAAVKLVDTGYGKQLMDSIRQLVARMSAAQEQAALDQFKRSVSLTYTHDLVFAFSALLNLAVLFWAYHSILRENRGREAAAAEARDQKELLEVTLTSIGEAVIITDARGRITGLNHTGEQLTGWRESEALNLPGAEVFKIINEETRQPLESPIDKALREGGIVALANHTLLIRKDGAELAIDDSGSPIRDANGVVRGAVLIFRDISHQRDAERQLLSINQALRTASDAKDQFIATLSHELRTPLTPVLATLTAWEAADGAAAAPRQEDLRMLRRNIEHEARLIDDLLDLTRISRGKFSLNPELTDVHEVLQSAIETHQSDFNRKRLDLSLALAADTHYAIADPARVQQIFSNVLSNAIKFTPYGGRIAVMTRNDRDLLVIEIIDNGIGMDAELLSRLFRPFEQGASAVAEQYGGLGLGMAIARSLVEAHHGSIKASSPGPNKGATFMVALPAVQPSVKDDHEKPTQETQPMSAGRGRSILIVEDHDDTAEVMLRLLSKRGFRVSRCSMLSQALDAIKTQEFDLILSDIGLPDGTGVELVRWLRGHSLTPAIALTGYGSEQDSVAYREAGFSATLTKPVNFQRLVALLDQLLPPSVERS